MKVEATQQGEKALLAVAGAATTWGLSDVSTLMAIFAGGATTVYVIAQLAFLLRKWWLLEKRAKPPKWDSTSH